MNAVAAVAQIMADDRLNQKSETPDETIRQVTTCTKTSKTACLLMKIAAQNAAIVSMSALNAVIFLVASFRLVCAAVFVLLPCYYSYIGNASLVLFWRNAQVAEVVEIFCNFFNAAALIPFSVKNIQCATSLQPSFARGMV
jgi:hypothetical protein